MEKLVLILGVLLPLCAAAPFDPNAINQNFGSFGTQSTASSGFNYDPDAINHNFGSGGFGSGGFGGGGGFPTVAPQQVSTQSGGNFNPNSYTANKFDPNALNNFGTGTGGSNFDPNSFGKK